jgi:flagellar hook assembly protein FlgD
MDIHKTELGVKSPDMILTATPNPAVGANTIKYRIQQAAHVQIAVYDASGRPVRVLVNKKQQAGTYTLDWNTGNLPRGSYFVTANKNGILAQTVQFVKQ